LCWIVELNKLFFQLIGNSEWHGSGDMRSIFASSSYNPNDGVFYVFAGYRIDTATVELFTFTSSDDLCSVHTTSESCLGDQGCQWCQPSELNTSGVCSPSNQPISTCNGNLTVGQQCTVIEMETRDCDTFTSCSTCMSEYGDNNKRCNWCRCSVKPGVSPIPRTCKSKNQPCQCDVVTYPFDIARCHKGDCYTSTCKNCKGNCFWTTHFTYLGETQRGFKEKGFGLNCYTKQLLRDPTFGTPKILADAEKACPPTCETLTTCESCVASEGWFILSCFFCCYMPV